MKTAKYIVITSFCYGLIVCGSARAQKPETQPAGNVLSQIQNRIENGDQGAIEEAAKLPINQAVSLLSIYAHDASTNKARAEQARETLRNLPGLSAHMKHQLLKLRSKPAGEYDTSKEFELLVAIGGEESAAATAPFLFVDDPPVLLGDDMATLSIKVQAVYALANMHLPDRPVDKEYYQLDDSDIEAWKAWAIKKGYKDNSIPQLMTFEEKGIPPKIAAQTEAVLARAKAESQATPQATPPPQSTPLLAASTPRPSATATPAVAMEKSSFNFPIIPVGILVLAIIGGAVFFLRRKSS